MEIAKFSYLRYCRSLGLVAYYRLNGNAKEHGGKENDGVEYKHGLYERRFWSRRILYWSRWFDRYSGFFLTEVTLSAFVGCSFDSVPQGDSVALIGSWVARKNFGLYNTLGIWYGGPFDVRIGNDRRIRTFFPSIIDEDRIYGRALTDSETHILAFSPVPEPAIIFMIGIGLVGLAGARRR